MKIKIEFEVDDLKYKRYQRALDIFLSLLYEDKVYDGEVVIHED